mmetsp:Transcript_28160/g.79362  ORF Transcript_28160/g.79362 Transcript_28160/m.79362 type:complete len:206 (-) Transcript_28160:273-890(-)
MRRARRMPTPGITTPAPSPHRCRRRPPASARRLGGTSSQTLAATSHTLLAPRDEAVGVELEVPRPATPFSRPRRRRTPLAMPALLRRGAALVGGGGGQAQVKRKIAIHSLKRRVAMAQVALPPRAHPAATLLAVVLVRVGVGLRLRPGNRRYRAWPGARRLQRLWGEWGAGWPRRRRRTRRPACSSLGSGHGGAGRPFHSGPPGG